MIVVFDIDNTLYDFASPFAKSTRSFVHVTAKELDTPEDRIAEALKVIFARHKTLEYQFLLQDLSEFVSISDEQMIRLAKLVSIAARRVHRIRRKLYPDIQNVLRTISQSDASCIAFSNAPYYQLALKLQRLKVARYFDGIVCFRGVDPIPSAVEKYQAVRNNLVSQKRLFKMLSEDEVKPSPKGFEIIRDCFPEAPLVMIGDSLETDLRPAKSLGFATLWARYGTTVDEGDLATLLEYTPWKDDKIIQHAQQSFVPDYVVDRPLEILKHLDLPGQIDLFH